MLTIRNGHASKTIYVDCQDTLSLGLLHVRLKRNRETFGGHNRVLMAAVSKDGQWIVSIIEKTVVVRYMGRSK